MNNQISNKQLGQLRIVFVVLAVVMAIGAIWTPWLWSFVVLSVVLAIATFFMVVVEAGAPCYRKRLGKASQRSLLPGLRLFIPIVDKVTPVNTMAQRELTLVEQINTKADPFVATVKISLHYSIRETGVCHFADKVSEKVLSERIKDIVSDVYQCKFKQYSHDELGTDTALQDQLLTEVKQEASEAVLVDGVVNGVPIAQLLFEFEVKHPDPFGLDPAWLELQGNLVKTKKQQEISAGQVIVAENEKAVTMKNAEALKYAKDQEYAAYLDMVQKLRNMLGIEKAGKILANQALERVTVYNEGNSSGSGPSILVNQDGVDTP